MVVQLKGAALRQHRTMARRSRKDRRRPRSASPTELLASPTQLLDLTVSSYHLENVDLAGLQRMGSCLRVSAKRGRGQQSLQQLKQRTGGRLHHHLHRLRRPNLQRFRSQSQSQRRGNIPKGSGMVKREMYCRRSKEARRMMVVIPKKFLLRRREHRSHPHQNIQHWRT